MRRTCSILAALLFLSTFGFAQSHPNLDDTNTGWASCDISCAGGTGTASAFPRSINNPSPSLDGEAMEVSVTGPALSPGQTTNVLWYDKVGANNTLNTFTGIYNVNFPSLSKVAAAEYDQFQFNAGTRFMMGSQCLIGGVWQIWNSCGANWVNTAVSCNLTANAWHSITWNTHRDPLTSTACGGHPCEYYDSLTFDSTVYNSFPAQPACSSADGDNVGIQVQIDLNSSGGTATEFVDEMSLTTSAGTPTFSYAPNPVAMGNVTLGTNYMPTVTITNGGTGPLVIGALSSNNAQFALAFDQCSGQSIGASGTCTFVLVFRPAGLGLQSATITVPDNAGNPDTISASGTGVSLPAISNNAYCAAGDVCSFPNDGPAQGPQAGIYTARSASPSNGATLTVNVAADFTAAIAAAACGDNIVLTAGITIQVNAILPAKSCDSGHWVTIKTSAVANLPPEGTRITPCFFGVGSLPGRPNFNCTSTTKYGATILSLGRGNTHALTFAAGANDYRLIGIELAPDPAGVFGDQPVRGVVIMSNGNLDHIILDQTWCHGYAGIETEYCTILSGVSTTTPTTYISFIDSFLSDFHCVAIVGLCGDAYAIGYGGSQGVEGPYKIVNNFIEASAENLFSGGSPATTVPSDVEVRLNYFFKPQTWNPSSSTYNGGLGGHAFTVKNILENKNVNREFIEGNIFQNSWAGFSQVGEAITLTPKNIGTCSVCEVVNVISRYNAGNNVAATYQIANTNATGTSFYSYAGNSYSIHDEKWDDIGDPLTCGGNSLMACVANPSGVTQTLNTNPANNVATNIQHDLFFNHETMVLSASPAVNPSSAFYIDGPNGAVQTHFTFTNSIFTAGTYGLGAGYSGVGTHCGYGFSVANVTNWLNACWTGWNLTRNATVGAGRNGWNWPANGVSFPASYSAVGFTNLNSGNGGNYALLNTSPYHNAATDGSDIGANIPVVTNFANFAFGFPTNPPSATVNTWGSGAGSGNFTIGWH